MQETILKLLKEYLLEFPEEQERQKTLIEYLNIHSSEQITDWNNFDGHIVASGFIYAKEEQKFLVLYHKDLKMYLYPGGHINQGEQDILKAAKREIKEETGLTEIKLLPISKDDRVPIDIDTHIIEYNERLNLPKHYHFDFRYLFTINKLSEIDMDTGEHSSYKWIDMKELENDPNYGKITSKIKKYIQIKKD